MRINLLFVKTNLPVPDDSRDMREEVHHNFRPSLAEIIQNLTFLSAFKLTAPLMMQS